MFVELVLLVLLMLLWLGLMVMLPQVEEVLLGRMLLLSIGKLKPG